MTAVPRTIDLSSVTERGGPPFNDILLCAPPVRRLSGWINTSTTRELLPIRRAPVRLVKAADADENSLRRQGSNPLALNARTAAGVVRKSRRALAASGCRAPVITPVVKTVAICNSGGNGPTYWISFTAMSSGIC